MSANMGVMVGIVSGVDADGDSMGGLLLLPLLGKAEDRVNESVLRHGIEEPDEVVVGGIKCDIWGCVVEVGAEVVPKLWDGKLSWVLWVEVLEYDI